MTRLAQRALASAVRYWLGRLAQAGVVLWAAFSVSFVILYALPSDPVSIMLNQSGEQTSVDAAQVARLRAEYHLDQPVIVQYGLALERALHLDFGHSIQTGQPVAGALLQALPATAQLAFAALALALLLGVGLALIASLTRVAWLRDALLGVPALAVSLPTFWLGLLLLQGFSFGLHWFPAMGNRGLPALVLPALTLAIPTAAIIAQVLLRSMATVHRQPFVEALRAKGLGWPRVVCRHILHNALIPVLSLAGVIVGSLLAGSVVTETVFSRQGVGRLAQAAVSVQDIPMVQGVVVLAAVIFVLVNLLVDALYPWLDPRLGKR
ncbi:ABC transporter permease [Pseudomonas eucalypticola]|uniref:ABC transporter permease n=1 Tax=Pseudomonas eucalypticola TaxID=2599595 RepID=A0A7D5HNV7_9PSED|nr:ABC transporter permease [Pseudomonas eucalypticola]QKZ04808.1 ABC transporter permease [Pseudomonas eucalypticola]